MAEGTENNMPQLPSSGGSGKKNNEVDYLDSTRSKSAGDAVNDAKNKVETAGKVAKAIGGVIKAIASIPVAGPIIIAIIVIIIIVIGVYYFVTTIPGLAIGNLKSILQGGIDLVQSWFLTESDAMINEDDIVELANYLEEMEYDLVGSGFIVPNSSNTSDYPTYEDLLNEGYLYGVVDYDGTETYRYYKEDGTIYDGSYYNSLGVLIDNETGSIEVIDYISSEAYYIDEYGFKRSAENISSNGQGKILGIETADTTLLRTYLLSDYRIYSIRNNDEKLTNAIFAGIKRVFGGYDSSWAKGLMKFYYAENGQATKEWSDDLIATLTNGWLDFGDSISVKGTELTIRQGTFNNPITFDIDGWADRYGMSLEFLLSLQIATGSPDLVYAMLQSFDTEVQVYLNDSGDATVEGGYVDLINDSATTSDMITWDDITATLDQAEEDGVINAFQHWGTTNDDKLNWIDSLSLTKKTCQYLLDNLPLESPYNCTGQAEVDIILESTYKNTHWYSWDNLLTEFDIDRALDLGAEANNLTVNDRDVETDEGDYVDFNGANCTYNLVGNEDDDGNVTNDGNTESLDDIIDDDNYKFFYDTGYSLGYTDEDAEIEIETESADDVYCNNAVTDQYALMVFDIDATKTTRTWTAVAKDADGNEILDENGETEEVEYEWITYKFVVYRVGDNWSPVGGYTECESQLLGVVVWEYITRDKTYEELVACGAIDENGNEVPRSSVCSAVNKDDDDSNDITKCCKNCQKYVKKVLKAMANITDENYAFYTPYISRVLGSWFRDTYFIIPSEADKAIKEYINEASRSSAEMSTISNSYGDNGSFVIVDEEYLAETEEYWTAYVMKKDENGNATDEYQLYYMEPDGTTTDTTMEEWLEANGYESQELAEADGAVFVKKAQTRTANEVASNSENAATIGTEVIWSAYSFGEDGATTGWQKAGYGEGNDYIDAVYDQIGGEDAVINTDDGGFYYNITSTNTVTQTEDAQRSETNSTVKWLFKYRKYYIYDGTTSTALTIAEDKEAVITAVVKYLKSQGISTGTVAKNLGKYGRSALRQTYATVSFQDSWYSSGTTISEDGYELAEQWLEWQLDMYYSGVVSNYVEDDGDVVTYSEIMLEDIEWTIEYDDDGDGTIDRTETRKGDPRNPDLIGTVNITKTSLNAFTILENTKTLAAEYAYRDFKELIVELNYFDKEDLSEKVDSVFTWILPDISAMGWPIRPWDKQDTDYGALIESSGTYDYLEEVNYDPIGLDPGSNEESTDDEGSDNTSSGDNTSSSTGDNTTDNTSSTDTEGNQTILDKAQEILEVMIDEGWHYQSGSWSDGLTTWEIAQSSGSKATACDTYVSWVLQETGYLGEGQRLCHKSYGDSGESVKEAYGDNLTDATWYFPDCTTSTYDDLLPGDVVIIENGDWQSIAIYAGQNSSGNNLYYGALSDRLVEDIISEGGPITFNSFDSGNLVAVVRFAGGSTTASAFEGYSGGELVASPVTGKVIEYGTHERTNVYTGDTEEVGYITIQVLDGDEDNQWFSSSNVTSNSEDFEITDEVIEEFNDATGENITSKEEYIAYGLNEFYNEYEDVCAGYIITIDGINIDLNATDESGNNGMYEENEVVALYNSSEQTEREAKEVIKYNAPFIVSVGGSETIGSLSETYSSSSDSDTGLYIKEGKYIGTTYTDEESAANVTIEASTPDTTSTENPDEEEFVYDGPANYIRIMVKDTDYSIIDYVEDFFDIPEEEESTSGEYSDDILVKFIDAFENGAVYEYLFEDGEYTDYVSKYITEDKQYFICYNDGTGKDDRNYGFGILVYYNGSYQAVDYFAAEGVAIDDGSYIDIGVSKCSVDVVLAVQAAEIEGKRQLVISCIGETNFNKLTTEQQNCLIDIAYQGCSSSSWATLKNLLDNNATAQEVVDNWPRLTSTEYNNQNRADARKKLWLEGIYTDASGNVIE